jgi:hypothetical protein
MADLRPDMNATTFVRWTVKGSEIPVSWEEAVRRLGDAATGYAASGEASSETPRRSASPSEVRA